MSQSYQGQSYQPKSSKYACNLNDKRKKKQVDILWITPIRLTVVFAVSLFVTIYFNGL